MRAEDDFKVVDWTKAEPMTADEMVEMQLLSEIEDWLRGESAQD